MNPQTIAQESFKDSSDQAWRLFGEAERGRRPDETMEMVDQKAKHPGVRPGRSHESQV